MFAIITPALIVCAIPARVKYAAAIAFVAAWMLVAYFPLAHMIWGVDELMNGAWNPKAAIKGIDFAGGTVVQLFSCWSALVLCLILEKRGGFGRLVFAPHSLVPPPRWRPRSGLRCGRFWNVTRGKLTVLGFCSGAGAGLVVITPGAGFVTPSCAVLSGVLSGVVPFLAGVVRHSL